MEHGINTELPSSFDDIAVAEMPPTPLADERSQQTANSSSELMDILQKVISSSHDLDLYNDCPRLLWIASISKDHRQPVLSFKANDAQRILDFVQSVSSWLYCHLIWYSTLVNTM
jgi:hypothetical protein